MTQQEGYPTKANNKESLTSVLRFNQEEEWESRRVTPETWSSSSLKRMSITPFVFLDRIGTSWREMRVTMPFVVLIRTSVSLLSLPTCILHEVNDWSPVIGGP